MTTLYGIDREGNLQQIEAVETKKMYELSHYVSWLGYVSQISKDDHRVHLSSNEAVSGAIAELTRDINALEYRLDKTRKILEKVKRILE